MVQNRKIGAGLALVTGLIVMGVNRTAAALPEVEVGTMPPIVAPQSANTLDNVVAASGDEDALDPAF